MALNWARMDPKKLEALIKECVDHLRWSFELYEMQQREGRYFLNEHPYGAWSWYFHFVQALMNKFGVIFVKGAQCPFGQWIIGFEGEGLVLKETGWLTNSEPIARR
eukprot:1182260-Heterocapsa_arctica.AAC.1